MKKRFFHVSARVLVNGMYRDVEHLAGLEVENNDDSYLPVADIRKCIVNRIIEDKRASIKSLTFLLCHVEEIDEDNYCQLLENV